VPFREPDLNSQIISNRSHIKSEVLREEDPISYIDRLYSQVCTPEAHRDELLQSQLLNY